MEWLKYYEKYVILKSYNVCERSDNSHVEVAMEVQNMMEQKGLMMANRYFNRRMRVVFIDRVCAKGIETFAKYLSYRYRDNCYYYSGYSIMGLNDNDYLVRGNLCISGNFIWENGGYSHGWVEFKYRNQEYVFDSMCKGVVPKDEWYNEFRPNVKFKYTKKEIIDSLMVDALLVKKDYYEFNSSTIHDYYTGSIYKYGRLFICNGKVKKFIAYDEPSG